VPHTGIAVTETTVMRHQNWDAHAVVPTHAHALVYVWNWLTLLAHPLVDMAVLHDLETPFFGLMRYDVGLNEEAPGFVWLDAPNRPEALAAEYSGEYVLSPTSLANRLLAGLEGSEPLVTNVGPDAPAIRCLAARRPDGGLSVVAINRSAESIALGMPVTGEVRTEALTADSLAAKLPGEFRVAPTYHRVQGETTEVRLPAWSVTRIEGNAPDE
jgi:hypothetical protein